MGSLDELVAANRMPILFVGSGISKRYLYKYPSWSELLEMSFSKFEPDTYQYQKHIGSCKRKNMTEFEINAYMGTLIEEHVFPKDFQVFIRQHELFSADSYNIAEIYKIHGSATDAESIIITQEDYKQFKASRKLIIAKMLTLFAESPIVFLGYSFTDENVREIIEDFLSCLSEKQRETIRKHFIFVSHKKGEEALVEIERTISTKNGVEIPFVEIQTDNYGLIYDKLSGIVPGISPLKVRETRRVVKTIVDQNMASVDAESIIVGIDDLTNMEFSSKPLAIAIGYKESILNKYGYGLLEESQIFEDIIFDNKHFDAEAMCTDRLKGISRTRLMPVFKYVKNQQIPESEKLGIYIREHNSLEKIIANNIAKTLRNIPKFECYDQVEEQMFREDTCRKAAMTVLKNIDVLSVEELRDACKYLYNTYPTEYFKETNSKRCVLCLDFMENCKE